MNDESAVFPPAATTAPESSGPVFNVQRRVQQLEAVLLRLLDTPGKCSIDAEFARELRGQLNDK